MSDNQTPQPDQTANPPGVPVEKAGFSAKIASAASAVTGQVSSAAAAAKDQALEAKERAAAAAMAAKQQAASVAAAAKQQTVSAASVTKEAVVNTAVGTKEAVVSATVAAKNQTVAAKDQVVTAAAATTAQVAGKISDVGGKVNESVEQAKTLLAAANQAANEASNFVSIESESDRVKRKNLFYVSASIGFVWMLFHFTVVFFFGLELKSAALVGIFLGIGNILAFALDVPVGILQRYFYAKRLYLFAAVSQLLAALIFLKFIYASAAATGGSGDTVDLLKHFMSSGVNLLLLVLASLFYGFTKEVNDITTLSYILNNSDPSEYSSIISKNNIFA